LAYFPFGADPAIISNPILLAVASPAAVKPADITEPAFFQARLHIRSNFSKYCSPFLPPLRLVFLRRLVQISKNRFMLEQDGQRIVSGLKKSCNSAFRVGGSKPMTRLFFDLVGPKTKSFDYQGRYFRDTEEAHEHARVLSLDLSCTETDEWRGGEVEVRDDAGHRLFSVPVVELAEMRAAA
jgi:hypothetical protein